MGTDLQGLTRRHLVLATGLACAAVWPLRGVARPKAQPEDRTIFGTGSDHYRAARLSFDGPPGLHRREAAILVPIAPAPRGPRPVLHALDGHAVLALLDEVRLAQLAAADAPVIVAHGHAGEGRFALQERTRDYTPADADGATVEDPTGRKGGGAAAFREALTGQILPAAEAEAGVPIDPARRWLWGHSYGGLFALDTAIRPRPVFARFVASSPSLWWQGGAWLSRARARIEAEGTALPPVDFTIGSAEAPASDDRPANEAARRMLAMREAIGPEALPKLAALIRAGAAPGVESGVLTTFPDLGHGESFAASLSLTLDRISGRVPV